MKKWTTMATSMAYDGVAKNQFQKRVEQARSHRTTWRRWMALLWLALGPGVLVMIGDNDAGGVITYAQTGAAYGHSLFVPLILLLIPVSYLVQEMTVRLGAVTGRGHAELIFERFGRFWGYFSLIDLVFGNTLTVITEFVGIGTGLSFLGVPFHVAVVVSAVLAILLVVSGSYWRSERLILLFAAFNLVFVPLALHAHVRVTDVATALAHWNLPGGFTSAVLFLIIANIGTTIAPWMLFYQQSAVVDKGMTPRDIRLGRIDTFLGSIIMGIVAIAIILTTATVLHAHHVDVSQFQPRDYLVAMEQGLGHTGMVLFAIGLVEAGFVAAITISLSSAYALGEVFGWRRSLNCRIKDAPGFYLTYVGTVAVAAGIVLIPGLPLGLITQTVQVVATILMPPALLFLFLLLNDRELMGSYVNSRWTNIATTMVVLVIVALSSLLGLSTIFPDLIPA